MVFFVYNVWVFSLFLIDVSVLLLNLNVLKIVSFKEFVWNVGIWCGFIVCLDEFYVFFEYGGFWIGN